MKHLQRGSVIVGVIIGVVLGLAAALAVAVYVTKVPVPFVNKGGGRTAEQDAAESKKNQNWDPNAPLYGKNPAKAAATASAPAVAASGPAPAASSSAKGKDTKDSKETAKDRTLEPPAVVGRPSADPLGDLAAARSGTPPAPAPAPASGSDPFLYFVQAGAFRTAEDAEAQRAKLSLIGVEAKVLEREQAGRQVFRVRVGPFERKEDADRSKEKLEAGGFETALVRVQR